MCGIAGIVHADSRPVDPGVLLAMCSALAHRGPDDQGVYAPESCSGPCVGLGHRRLSIIDLSPQGRQPMSNEDGTVWVTFNGEIYNFRELRAELEGAGHVFASDTDTEVIVHGYEQYGEDILAHLNGMFALGLWDARRGVLVLARDRYGKKPLYYAELRGDLAFASELTAMLRVPWVPREVDRDSLSRYLLHEFVPSPHSMLRGVRKLPRGHLLRWAGGRASVRPYWELRLGGTGSPDGAAEAGPRLVEELTRAVRRRLVSDVPLGVFLSGGIDSSSIVALLREAEPGRDLKTFSVAFREPSFDESSHARAVAGRFGTDHHEFLLDGQTMLGLLDEVWDRLDEPFADHSVFPTYFLSKRTREHVTVVLGGDGGDELFAGYDPFPAHMAARWMGWLPGFAHGWLRGAAGLLPASTENISLDFKIKRFLAGADKGTAVRNQVWLGAFDRAQQRRLLAGGGPEDPGFDLYAEIDEAVRGLRFRDWKEEVIYLFVHFYLEYILQKVDRASMAVALEVREPFLDADFSAFAHSLPSDLKLRGLTRKYILRKAMAGRLPEAIVSRPKKGFGVPLAAWFKGELKPMLLEMFSPAAVRAGGEFDPDYVTGLLERHFQGREDNRKQILALVMYEKWKERVLAPAGRSAFRPTGDDLDACKVGAA